jgi:Predicted membrane protein
MSHPPAQCAVCGQIKPAEEIIPGILVRPAIDALIRRKQPSWTINDTICTTCHNSFRTDYVMEQVHRDNRELSALDQAVVESIRQNQIVTDNINKEFESHQTVGARVADKVASFGGSWKFIFIFFAIMAAWIAANSVPLLWRPFDPFPFILFNLVLSMLAAVQAPIIMMSQNRQEARDRRRAENDYEVNLKAEIEVRVLSEKMDQLLHHQWQRLLEIQRMQTEMIEDLAKRTKG